MPGHFGDRLKLTRKTRGLTMKQLGASIGLAKTTISGYENGNREPPLDIIYKLASTLRTSADYLLGLTDIMEQPLLHAHGNVTVGTASLHWDGIELEETELESIRQVLESILLQRQSRKTAEP
jgi:transcriptional regulator with XRE-family HTH domain